MLKKVNWSEDRSYRTGTESEPLLFYMDGLCNSRSFDLLLGYFSSAAINVLSLGFATFLYSGGKVRMIVNNVLSQEDRDSIKAAREGEVPSAQRKFFEIIKEVSKSNVQTLISTHSTVFIDKSKLKTIRSVSIQDNAYTEYNECESVDEVFESLELKNSDFLFYDKFLVIEGDTEAYLIPELYKLYKGNTLEEDNIQLINLTGKNKWLEGKKALENVFNGFKKSQEYVIYLFDSDMRNELGEEAITDCFFFAGKQDIICWFLYTCAGS